MSKNEMIGGQKEGEIQDVEQELKRIVSTDQSGQNLMTDQKESGEQRLLLPDFDPYTDEHDLMKDIQD